MSHYYPQAVAVAVAGRCRRRKRKRTKTNGSRRPLIWRHGPSKPEQPSSVTSGRGLSVADYNSSGMGVVVVGVVVGGVVVGVVVVGTFHDGIT